MTISGSTSVEVLIPGNPQAIQAALDTATAGIEPARNISNAWGSMRIPGWKGQAGTAWNTFTPREATYTGKLPDAMSTVASALADYQAAFNTARAEAQAAILDAQAAERLTSDALTAHQTATRKAATAKPGTPEAKVTPYQDPGAIPLAQAQARLDNARAALNTAGNTAAARINHAASQTSNATPTITGAGNVKPTIKPAAAPKTSKPPIEWWDQILQFPGRLVEGFLLQGADTAVGFWEMLPVAPLIDSLFGDEDAWVEYGQYWKNIADAIVADPGSVPREIFLDFIAADHWDGYAGEGVGRVIFNVATIVVAPVKLAKLGKIGKVGSASKVKSLDALLKSSKNVKITDGKVYVKGVEKMSLKGLEKLYEQSVHNMDAKQATLGKWIEDSPKSYEKVAEEAGDAHFNLPDGKWDKARDTYNVTDGDLYDLLNKPFLEEIVQKRLPVKFTTDPRGAGGALQKEWNFLKDKGYNFDPDSLTAFP